MMRRIRPPLLLVLALALSACATARPAPPPLGGDAALHAFFADVEAAVEAHRWADVLAMADPAHRETQLGEMGMGEPQYVAELLGLNTVGNAVADESPPAWPDLERIADIEFTSARQERGRWMVDGTARLEDGRVLRVGAQAVQRPDGFRLTGAVG